MAAGGLADKEIAQRLAISHRTVRTHFERLFRDYQVRNRSAAVSAWLLERPPIAPARPADECPYSRPFPEAFSDCPAYQAMEMMTLDISYRPLGRLWTCRHLQPRRQAGDDRWYAKCAVGNADDRENWAAALGRERLLKIEALRAEMALVTAPFVERIWRYKREQLELVKAGQAADAATQELKRVIDRLGSRINAVLRRQRALLDEIHLPEAACRELIRVALDHLVTQQSVDFELDVPDDVLARFPSDMRLFLRPRP